MSIFDLVLIFSVLIVFSSLLIGLFALVTRRWVFLRRLMLGLAVYIGVYAFLLIIVSLLSPQQMLPMHQLRCFDDWCLSVEQVEQQASIGAVQAQGVFYLVTVQVTSQAKRVSQRAADAAVYLLDDQGNRYDLSVPGQQALEAAGGAGQPLRSVVDAGDSFQYTAVFDLPIGVSQPGLVISHGAFPGVIIIGNDQSFLHKPTIMRLSAP